MNRIGYACINTELLKNNIRINRSMKQGFFLKNDRNISLEILSERILYNTKDLLEILKWNVKHNIYFYRMSSDMFTCEHLYKLEELPDWEFIQKNLKKVGKYVKDNNIRLSFHPGPYNVLSSTKKAVIEKTINNLNFHSRIMDEIGLSKTFFNPINIHVGGAFNDKKNSLERFAKNWERLNDSTKLRINIENDDRPNLYSIKDLLYLHKLIKIPICFDFLHHKFCNSLQSEEEALYQAAETWGDITPVVHISSSICFEYSKHNIPRKHADYLYEKFDNYNLKLDYMVEAKQKEKALIKWLTEFR